MKRRKLSNLLIIFVFMCILCFGVSLVVYPIWSAHQQNTVISSAVDTWKDQQSASDSAPVTSDAKLPESHLPSVMPELYMAMDAYNKHIYETQQVALDSVAAYEESVIDLTEYELEEDSVGLISIPKIDIEMSIFLGASSENMAKGFAHMGQTSLPIGGENTNCVVAGHRGWRGAPYMRDAHLLEIGDVVYLENFWGTLEYRVCGFETIWPDNIDAIKIQPGRDLLTIVTCTPYGEGYQRLLVICERYYPESGDTPQIN